MTEIPELYQSKSKKPTPVVVAPMHIAILAKYVKLPPVAFIKGNVPPNVLVVPSTVAPAKPGVPAVNGAGNPVATKPVAWGTPAALLVVDVLNIGVASPIPANSWSSVVIVICYT